MEAVYKIYVTNYFDWRKSNGSYCDKEEILEEFIDYLQHCSKLFKLNRKFVFTHHKDLIVSLLNKGANI